jgi:hypothetical protein
MRRLLAIVLFLLATASHAELAVVAGKGSPIDKLGEREVADIFLARTHHLADGSRVRPVELRDSAYKADFYRGISGKTLPQINSYWTTLIFTGKGKPPRSVDELERLVELLNSDPQAIAYLPLGQIGQLGESLKILFVFR